VLRDRGKRAYVHLHHCPRLGYPKRAHSMNTQFWGILSWIH
jgi:hypothetical protein